MGISAKNPRSRRVVNMDRKWRRAYKAKENKHQTILAPTYKTGCTTIKTESFFTTADANQLIMCPFCLHTSKLSNFIISTKKGIHQGLGQCPECKHCARWHTLTAEWTPEQYAEWVFQYSTSGFWQKTPFKTWSSRLKKIGWAYKFWKRYKQLKAETGAEEPTIIEKQERERWICPKCGERNQPNTTFCTYCKMRLIESYG